MNNRKIFRNASLALGLLAAGSVYAAETGVAETTQATAGVSSVPGEQGVASVNRNLESNPDNKGLQTASEQLNENQVRQAEQTAKRSEKREQRMTGKAERHERASRPDRAERRGL